MVPNIAPKVFHNEYYQYAPKDNDLVMDFYGRDIVSKADTNDFLIPTVSDYKNAKGFKEENLLYLYCIDDISYYLWLGEEYVPEGFAKNEIGNVRKYDNFKYLEVFTAWHLHVWYRDNKYCGRCGRPTTIGRKERNLLCECGNMIFPKIMPAVIVGVRKGEQILMTRYANRGYTGYALIAGFVEIGETVEQTVKREVLEEVGIHVDNITYYASQPWGIDQDLLLGFFCDAVGNEDIHIDEMELAVGEWVNRKDMPVREDTQSLTATMMEAFRTGRDC